MFVMLSLISLARFITLSAGLPDSPKMDVSRGREQYHLIKSQASLPKFGPCWKSALEALESGCKSLSEDTQHKLAFKFMNCFLIKAGRDEIQCEEALNCAGIMDPSSLQIYNDYFIHTNNMCSFLQIQVWNEQTSSTIERLSSTSRLVADQLSESSEITQRMLQQQENSLKNQQDMSDAIATSFADYRRTTKQQQLMIGEVFDKITNLQSVVVGEFAGFYSLIYHAMSIVISYLLTSTPRTNGARFWLFALSLMNIGVERLIIHWHTSSAITDNDAIYSDFWIARKIFWLAAVMILVKCAFNYKDFNVINNNLLLEIKRQVESRRVVKRGKDVIQYNESIDCTTFFPDETMNNNDDVTQALDYDQNDTVNDFLEIEKPSDETFLITPARHGMNNSLLQGFEDGESIFDITQEVTKTRYCFRRRTASPSWNPILAEESPDDFRKLVKKMAKTRKSP